MQLKPIKPGMAIHCKNDIEYEQLNAEVIKLGYGSLPCKDRANQYIVRNFVFCIESDGVGWEYKNEVAGEITEFSDLIIPEPSAEEEAYNKGLNDAWELAKKIVLSECDGGMGVKDFYNIFDKNLGVEDVLKKFTAQEALAKIEAYKKEQAEIKVGDVVSHDGLKGVVTRVTDDCIYTISYFGTTPRYSATESKKLIKTGKHIDISAILAEIGKE